MTFATAGGGKEQKVVETRFHLMTWRNDFYLSATGLAWAVHKLQGHRGIQNPTECIWRIYVSSLRFQYIFETFFFWVWLLRTTKMREEDLCWTVKRLNLKCYPFTSRTATFHNQRSVKVLSAVTVTLTLQFEKELRNTVSTAEIPQFLIFFNVVGKPRSVHECIKLYIHSMPPTCFSHSCGHPQVGALQRIDTSKYCKSLWIGAK